MTCRSWMIVPAHEEARLRDAMGKSADAVVLDLSACGETERPAARRLAAEWLGAHRTQVLESRAMARWVRIGVMGEGRHWRDDLLAVIPAAPDGIMLPRAAGPDQVRQLAAELYEIEQINGLMANSTRLLPVVGETAASALQIRRFVEDGHQRIVGLAWDPVALARSIDAKRSATQLGKWSQVCAHVRSELLLTAHACGIDAIDALPSVALEPARIAKLAKISAEDGFTGIMVTSGKDAAIVRKAFAENDRARLEGEDAVSRPRKLTGFASLPGVEASAEKQTGATEATAVLRSA